MIGVHKLNITWKDDNHAHIQDPDTGNEFNITVRPKTNKFVGGHPVKSRLYVGGKVVDEWEKNALCTHRQAIKNAKEYFGNALNKILNKKVELKFSAKAGCSCGCSPGFIIQDESIPFNIWMDAITDEEENS